MRFRFPNVGKCIYCNSTVPPLTREHVMPQGLGGNDAPVGAHEALVLQKASCESCRKITRNFEDACLTNNFGLTRYREGLRRKDRLRHTTKVKQDGKTVEARIDDLAAFMALPVISHATIYERNYNGGIPSADIRFIRTHGADRNRKSQWKEVTETEVPMQYSLKAFLQLLAKIAHGVTVGRYGIDGFTPTLQGLIRGTDSNFATWIGSNPNTRDDMWGTKNELHKLQQENTEIFGVIYELVWIRLFSSFKVPTYYVISGVLPPKPLSVTPPYQVMKK